MMKEGFNMSFQYILYESRFHRRGKLSFFLAGLCVLVFVCSAAVCFDHDLSYDHGDQHPLDLMYESPVFIDNKHLSVALIEFVNISDILPFLDRVNFFNKAPPARTNTH